MPTPEASTESAKQSSRGWIEKFGRLGYLTKGIVYGIIGVLAVQAAFSAGGSTTGTRGAILEIGDNPFGQILLALTALGLLGYAVWRFIEAAFDANDEGTDAKGIAKRLAYGVSALVHLGLSVWAATIVLGSGGGGGTSGGATGGGGAGGGGGSQQAFTAELMSQPFGQWLVAIVGAIILVVGLYHFKKAYTASFMEGYKRGEMSAQERKWAKRLGKWGLYARGVVFSMIGVFVIQAAIQADPSETKGLGGALQTLAEQPYGPWLLGLVAIGLISYGVYCVSRARYSRFSVE